MYKSSRSNIYLRAKKLQNNHKMVVDRPPTTSDRGARGNHPQEDDDVQATMTATTRAMLRSTNSNWSTTCIYV